MNLTKSKVLFITCSSLQNKILLAGNMKLKMCIEADGYFKFHIFC